MNQLPPLYIVLDDATSLTEDSIIAVSDNFFEACKSVYKVRKTQVVMFHEGKTTRIAIVDPHWHFFTLEFYNPFKYKYDDPVSFRDGKGRSRIGNIIEMGIFGGDKPLPPFDSKVIEYHANGVRVMEDDITLLNLGDVE